MKSVAAALLLASAIAAAEPIETDRPDFVESSSVVGRGRFQVETSVAHERDRGAHATTTPTLLRWGASDSVELRLETDGATFADGHRGVADATIGFKQALGEGVGWLVNATLPTGSAAFRGSGVRPETKLAFEWEPAPGWALGAMPGVFVDHGPRGRYAGAIAAVTLGRDVGAASHGFVELAGQRIAHRRDGGSVLTADVGGSHRLTDDVQVDAAVFVGLNRDAPKATATIGLSVRF